MKIVIQLLLLVVSVKNATSFIICNNNNIMYGRRSVLVLSASNSNDDKTMASSSSNVEFWLDLRGTRLMPSTIRAKLEEELQITGIVDRILIDEEVDSIIIKEEDDNEKYVIANNNNKLKIMDDNNDNKDNDNDNYNNDGTIVRLSQSGILEDALGCIDSITKYGKWVLIDEDARNDDEDQQKRYKKGITSFLELLMGSSSGAFIVFGDDDDEDITSDGDSGGVAWNCRTEGDILHAGTTLKSLTAYDGSRIESTSSGILLCTDDNDNNDNANTDNDIIQSAIVMPFDIRLWLTAAYVFLHDNTDNEFDEEEEEDGML